MCQRCKDGALDYQDCPSLDPWLSYCDSPMEFRLLGALTCMEDFHFWGNPEYPLHVGRWPQRDIDLAYQAPWRRYRCDLWLVSAREPWDAAGWALDIEVDGREHHDLVEQQIQRDRVRDRKMAMSGVRVLRFSGSEIYRNPERCAAEVLELASWHYNAAEDAQRRARDEGPEKFTREDIDNAYLRGYRAYEGELIARMEGHRDDVVEDNDGNVSRPTQGYIIDCAIADIRRVRTHPEQ